MDYAPDAPSTHHASRTVATLQACATAPRAVNGASPYVCTTQDRAHDRIAPEIWLVSQRAARHGG